jgi:two-component system sensor histidine kinase KdpD
MEGERLRTTLLSSLSHDLRSPLAGIEGAGTALLDPDTAADPHARAELAAAVVEESRRMARLITNLLDMMRIETGVPAVQRAWVPVEELIGVARLRVDERLARHPVTVHLPADLPLVPVDEILVEQALVNLLENAARHTPSGTPVSIGAWVESGSVVVEVADRGPGIPPGLEEEVFRKFYRGPGADDTGSGSGLGLAICRGVVAAHGGRIWAENSPLGGAAFRFTIPLDPAATGNSVEAIMTAVTDGAWAGRP